MFKSQKSLLTSGIGILAIGILLISKVARHKKYSGRCEKIGKNIDVKLKESLSALDKATGHVQSVLDHIKNKK